MARLRDHQPLPDEDREAEAEGRFRDLSRFLMASEPESSAAALSAAIRAEAATLSRRTMTDTDRLDALRRFIDRMGLLDEADRFADRLACFRSRLNRSTGPSPTDEKR